MTPEKPARSKDTLASSNRGFAVFALIVICVTIEFYLKATDFNVLGPSRMRSLAYEYGGFWSGLLYQWQPNYPLQPYTMFLTYGFLHSGLLHLAVNMITLWSVGRAVVDRVGSSRFLILYVGSMLGGGLGFGLLAPSVIPMVGASGALFGLVGAVLAWNYIDRFHFSENLWPVARATLFLVALNLLLWWAMDGQLAWQTHLGGFMSGWITALLIDPRPRDT